MGDPGSEDAAARRKLELPSERGQGEEAVQPPGESQVQSALSVLSGPPHGFGVRARHSA